MSNSFKVMGKNVFVCFEVPVKKGQNSTINKSMIFLSYVILIPREEILHGKSIP